jgi:hypothetical protein
MTSLNPLTWSETGLSLRSRGMAEYQDWKERYTESDENPAAITVLVCWRETGDCGKNERKQRGQIRFSCALHHDAQSHIYWHSFLFSSTTFFLFIFFTLSSYRIKLGMTVPMGSSRPHSVSSTSTNGLPSKDSSWPCACVRSSLRLWLLGH